jgi:hypothetical protein
MLLLALRYRQCHQLYLQESPPHLAFSDTVKRGENLIFFLFLIFFYMC